MAALDLAQRPLQSGRAKRAFEPHRLRHVVNRRPRLELFQEPQPLLRK